ncbi:MAG TPA: C2H2-type zinc finger protein [Actinomycetota bacterium]
MARRSDGYRTHMEETGATYTCPECGDTFPSAEELEAHDHTMPLAWERGTSNFECPTCGARYDEAADLITHQATTHPSDEPTSPAAPS